ncbi:MAG: type I methionyl aminopeptidase [Parcubacteria group bacterium]|nr:type I methionyl aminopeptidase [Parcubacteria group bacterium]
MITIKKDNEIELLRQGGKILARILKQLLDEVKSGISTGHLEQMADFLIRQAGGWPAFKGFKSDKNDQPYPTVLCASINNEVVHAPSLPSRQLKSGDIVGIDIGLEYENFYTDMAATVAVGKVSREAQKLIRATKEALVLGIKEVRPGNSLNNIGKVIEQYAKANNFSVVRDLAGHGVGYAVHEDPQIPNYDLADNKKIILKPGMVLAIEPMVNVGGWRVKDGPDKFTVLTADGGLSAHFEHTVLVTERGHEILTKFE